MPVMSFRIRDGKTQEMFERYCKGKGLSKGDAFEQMVQEYCKDYSVPDEHEACEKQQDHRAGFKQHLLTCFEEDGGTLQKSNRYFYENGKYLVYPYYRRLGKNESRMVRVDGTQVERLISLAEQEDRIPLVAVYIVDQKEKPILGVMQIQYIPRVQAEQGARISWENVFLREDNSAIYIHVRAQQDLDALERITRKSLSDEMFQKIFTEGKKS